MQNQFELMFIYVIKLWSEDRIDRKTFCELHPQIYIGMLVTDPNDQRRDMS